MDKKSLSYMNGYLKLAKVLYYFTKGAFIIAFLTTVVVAILNTSIFFRDTPVKNVLKNAGIDITNHSPFTNKLIGFFLDSDILIACLLATLIIKLINQIISTVMKKKPFAYENAVSIKKMGWVLIAQSLFNYTYSIFQELVLLKHSFNLSLLTPETPLILFGICLLILSGVFRYGCFLQEEYDSML
ncbi:DUF2975 domain-containing protein (plasmid) [Arthrobacter citreus]|nr:DUF2975 domain-containing protein [Arthrobacter citreus]